MREGEGGGGRGEDGGGREWEAYLGNALVELLLVISQVFLQCLAARLQFLDFFFESGRLESQTTSYLSIVVRSSLRTGATRPPLRVPLHFAYFGFVSVGVRSAHLL